MPCRRAISAHYASAACRFLPGIPRGNTRPYLLVQGREHEGAIDLVLSDVVMPRLGGLELAAQLRIERPGIAVIFTSGYAEQAVVHEGRLDEGVRFLPKPFLPSDLLEKIRECLSEVRAADEG